MSEDRTKMAPELGLHEELNRDDLIESYTKKMFVFARSLGLSKEIADEVVQDAWLVYFSRPSAFQGKSKLSTYLCGIVLNKSREYWRKNKKIWEGKLEDIDKVFEERFDHRGHWIKRPMLPQEFSHSVENANFFDGCLEKLPNLMKSAIHLRDVEEWCMQDICSQLGIKVNYLSVCLFRARNAMRECLEKLGVGSNA